MSVRRGLFRGSVSVRWRWLVLAAAVWLAPAGAADTPVPVEAFARDGLFMHLKFERFSLFMTL